MRANFASGGIYHATVDELQGIDRGLKAAREARFASDVEVKEVFAKHRPAGRLSTQEALADLDAILEFISSHYPGVYAAFERRIQALEARIGA